MGTEPQAIYRPRAGKRLVSTIVLLVLGGLTALTAWNRALVPSPADSGSPTASLVAYLSAGFLLLLGLAGLLALIRGVPRLTVDRHGLVLQSLFGTRSAAWERLGTFALAVAYEGRRGRKLLKATAPIVGPNVVRKPFTIPDAFEVPLAALLGDLATWRGHVAAGTPSFVPVVSAPERSFGASGIRWPWLTAGLLTIFVAVFILERSFAAARGDPGLSPVTLIALGGLNRDLVQSGQWYRMLSAPFLHGSWAHLIANGVAFALAGYALERLIGRAWMFSIFAAGAVAGSIASLLLSGPSTVSVGASGAIMAMLTALFLASLRLPAGRARSWIQLQSARVAIPALIPLSHGAAALRVDYGAHFGGALIGLALGFLLLRIWPEGSPLPGFRSNATAFAAVAALCFAGSAYAVAQRSPSYAAVSDMIPAAQYPHGAAAIAARADGLLANYPRDARSHIFAGAARAQRGDKAGAEQEFRTALSLTEASPFDYGPAAANTIRALLAEAILDQGRRSEASAVAHAACTATGDAALPSQAATALRHSGLCTGAGTDSP